jgi:two-component system chemotaxis response regulator CheB
MTNGNGDASADTAASSAVKKPIRVLVVDDSPTARELLIYILNSDPAIEVVGMAEDGEAAVLAAVRLKPDVITMDIHMPRMDGFLATRRIMESHPTRILIVSATMPLHPTAMNFRALEAGALTVLARPLGPGAPDFTKLARELTDTVKMLAEVNVVRRWKQAPRHPDALRAVPAKQNAIRLVAIGASTGGPQALRIILSQLPKDFAVPIAIVQHIGNGFGAGFAEWLGKASGYPTRLAQHGEQMQAGRAYVAPDGLQMQVTAADTVALRADPPEHNLRPSVAALFRSVAAAYAGQALGVLLTGMGRDGAEELLQMKLAGATTLVQDAESCIVNGMPGEAVKLGAASYVLTPEDIAMHMTYVVNGK